MKKILFFILVLSGFTLISQAQIAFVDTKFILNKIPDYQDSLGKLNYLSALWQKEIDDKQVVLDRLYKDFEKDEPMLSDEVKKKRTDQIFNSEKEIRDLQRMRFGFQGDLFKKRQELVKPLEDKVNAAMKTTAIRLGFSIVLDKSEGITVMYARPGLDITSQVQKEMTGGN